MAVFVGGRIDLRHLRDSLLVVEIPEWRISDARRKNEQRAKDEAQRKQTAELFARHERAISAGTQSGWLGWVAAVYPGGSRTAIIV